MSVVTMQSVYPWHQAGQGETFHVDASQCMGSASSIGLGLAVARPDKKVMVLDGDGSLLMQLGSLVTIAGQSPANLYHFVFANGLHQSTGKPVPASDRAVRLGGAREGRGVCGCASASTRRRTCWSACRRYGR